MKAIEGFYILFKKRNLFFTRFDYRFVLVKSIIYAALIFLIATGCNGQKKERIKSTVTKVYEDPMFVIKDQLCQHVRKIYQDNNGHMWFGTNVYDIIRYDGDTLQYFDKSDGLGGGRVTGIIPDKMGNIWFGMYGGLTKYNGHTFKNYKENTESTNNDIWSLLIDKTEQIWVGTNNGVRLFNGHKFTSFPIPKANVSDTTTSYSRDRIITIMEDRQGTIWFGTDGFGICKYDGVKFTHLTTDDGLPCNVIRDLYEDRNGNIWIATMFGGISLFDGKEFYNFTQDGKVDGIEVGGIFEDQSGHIWFATENHGVYRYDGSKFANYTTNEGLVTNQILCIFEDKDGIFWFGGWGGLSKYDGTTFQNVTRYGPWK